MNERKLNLKLTRQESVNISATLGAFAAFCEQRGATLPECASVEELKRLSAYIVEEASNVFDKPVVKIGNGWDD